MLSLKFLRENKMSDEDYYLRVNRVAQLIPGPNEKKKQIVYTVISYQGGLHKVDTNGKMQLEEIVALEKDDIKKIEETHEEWMRNNTKIRVLRTEVSEED